MVLLIKVRKWCCGCDEVKLRSSFNKHKNRKDGLQVQCRECNSSYLKEWGKARVYTKDQIDARRQRDIDSYYKIKDDPTLYKEMLEYRKLLQRRLWATSSEFRKKSRKRWKEYSENNREVCRERAREQYYKNKDRYNEATRRRRARKRNAEGSFTEKQFKRLCFKFRFRCLACGDRFPFEDLTRDHIVPLIKGGSNYIDNIQPLCAPCNFSKRVKIIDYRPFVPAFVND